MIRTFGYIKDYIPCKKLNKYSQLHQIQWDLVPDENNPETGSWMMEVVHTTPSEQSLKRMFDNYYNKETDRKILEDFVWHEHKVWLSSENQFNYKAAYDLAVQTGGQNLPVVFKFGTDEKPEYHTFETLEELSDFYFKAMQHINDALAEGWKKKDSFNWLEYKKGLLSL